MADKRLLVTVGANINEFAKGMKDVEKELKKTERSLVGFKQIGKRVADVGKTLTLGVTLPLMAIGTAATKMSTDFNAAMANVSTLIPGNTERVQELKTAVQDLSVAMGKSTSDMADGLYQVISAMGDTSDTVGILELSAKGATAGLSTTTEALELMAAVTKAYGDTTLPKMEQSMDLAFDTVRLGQTTFSELAGAIGTVTPLAASLGMEVEELFAGFATLTGVTGSTNQVSTQLAAILRAMMKPTQDMSKAIQSLGYETAQSMIEQLGMVGALRELITTTDGTQEAVGKLFGRAEALTAVFALTGGQAGVFDTKLAQLRDSAGATDRAFKEQTEGINELGFTWSQLRAQMEVTMQRIGDGLTPMLKTLTEQFILPLAEKIEILSKKFQGLDESKQKLIVTVGLVVAALGPTLLALGNLLIMIPKITTAIKLLKVSLMGPAGLIALIGVGLVGALVQATFAADGFNSSINEQEKLSKELDEVRRDMLRLEEMYPREALMEVAEYTRLLERERYLTDQLAEARRRANAVNTTYIGDTEAMVEQMQHLNRVTAEKNAAMRENVSIMEEAVEASTALKDAQTSLAEAVEDVEKAVHKAFPELYRWIELQYTADPFAALNFDISGVRLDFSHLIHGMPEHISGGIAPAPMAEGGIVTRPTVILAGERGPEAIMPLPDMPAAGPALVINHYGDVVSERTFQDMVVEAMRRFNLTNGPIPAR